MLGFATLVFGWLLIVSGAFQSVQAFMVRTWRGFFLHLLGGILEVVVGVLIVSAPTAAALTLTLLLSVYLLVGGLFRVIGAFALRNARAWWVALSGIITVLLGLALWRKWPVSGLWVIGTFVGADLIVHGVAWAAFALTLRKVPSVAA